MSAAGRPCSSTRANASVTPYSSAHRPQQRRTESMEETSVPSLSNRRASTESFMVAEGTRYRRWRAAQGARPGPRADSPRGPIKVEGMPHSPAAHCRAAVRRSR